MSERIRKAIGAGLILLALLLTAAGCFPLNHTISAEYPTGNIDEYLLPLIQYLDINDMTNRGDSDELQQLPGIGPSLAEAILQERKINGLFFYPEDLIGVKGIGEIKLAQIRSMLKIIFAESEE